jgi:hypothetical protein
MVRDARRRRRHTGIAMMDESVVVVVMVVVAALLLSHFELRLMLDRRATLCLAVSPGAVPGRFRGLLLPIPKTYGLAAVPGTRVGDFDRRAE